MNLKEFEKKWDLNKAAVAQVKKLIAKIKPTSVDIGCSTAFTLRFDLIWGKDLWDSDRLNINVETWGSNKRVEIYGGNNVRRLPLSKASVNRIYQEGIIIRNQMLSDKYKK